MLWRRRGALLLAGALALAALSTCRAEPARDGRAVPTVLGPLVVLDGDTLRLPGGERVRLVEVDTPELGRPFAAEARDFTAARLSAAQAIALSPPDPPHDHYGRLLADVVVDGASLSAALVQAGLATLYECEDAALIALQAAAVDGRAGMHARLAEAEGPFVVTSRRFHRPGCPWIRERDLDASADAVAPLRAGRSPCRTCLPWPP